MSNEIRVSIDFSDRNGAFNDKFSTGAVNVDQAIGGAHCVTPTITTADTALSITEVSSFGVAFFQNLDATNYIDIGPDATGAIVPIIRLLPGDPPAFLRLKPGITIRAQAHTASVKLAVRVYEA
jgi:hypothetical protein